MAVNLDLKMYSGPCCHAVSLLTLVAEILQKFTEFINNEKLKFYENVLKVYVKC